MPIQLVCHLCHKTFSVPPSRHRQRHCSDECRSAAHFVRDKSPIPLGTKIGAWTVAEVFPKSKGQPTRYVCSCICGVERAVQRKHLLKGTSTSCGCVADAANRLAIGLAAKNHLLSSRKHSARHRGYEWAITDDLFYALCAGRCHYCGCPPAREHKYKMTGGNGTFRFNGIDRLDNFKGYIVGNVVSCCYVCNRAKQDMGELDFLEWVSRVYKFRFEAAFIQENPDFIQFLEQAGSENKTNQPQGR